jgi:2',3'-cyclic-nucleotide 2'-phosphodiesterase (5'-nucleotidase family)
VAAGTFRGPRGGHGHAGIRSDTVASATRSTARAGDVACRDLVVVQPFGNVLTVVTMTGGMLKQLLEEQSTTLVLE